MTWHEEGCYCEPPGKRKLVIVHFWIYDAFILLTLAPRGLFHFGKRSRAITVTKHLSSFIRLFDLLEERRCEKIGTMG